jgi:hypothetical protein
MSRDGATSRGAAGGGVASLRYSSSAASFPRASPRVWPRRRTRSTAPPRAAMAVSGRRMGSGASGITGVGPVRATHLSPRAATGGAPASDGSYGRESMGPAHGRPSRPGSVAPLDSPSGAGWASAGEVSGSARQATTASAIRPTRDVAITRRRTRAIAHVHRVTAAAGRQSGPSPPNEEPYRPPRSVPARVGRYGAVRCSRNDGIPGGKTRARKPCRQEAMTRPTGRCGRSD